MQVKENSLAYQTKKKIFTYRDYLELPNDRNRYEILEGELIMGPAPKTFHQAVKRNIEFALIVYLRKNKLGKVYDAPCDVVFDNQNIFQPDIFFISQDHSKIITEDNIQGVPDLIIEILSPSTAYYDLVEKKEIYEKFGVQEYWIVDPKKHRIDTYTLKDGKYQLFQRAEKEGKIKSKLLKRLEIELSEIFEQEGK